MSPGRRNERATGGSTVKKAGGKVEEAESAGGTIGHNNVAHNSGGWQCSQCTFQNAGTIAGSSCEMCGQRRVTSAAATSSTKVGTEVRRVVERPALVFYGVRTTYNPVSNHRTSYKRTSCRIQDTTDHYQLLMCHTDCCVSYDTWWYWVLSATWYHINGVNLEHAWELQ